MSFLLPCTPCILDSVYTYIVHECYDAKTMKTEGANRRVNKLHISEKYSIYIC